MDCSKPIHATVLDAGPLLKNDPTISSLLAKSTHLVTVPSVILEIRDTDARSRVQTTWLPFIEQKLPSPRSITTITDFARKTGDLAVLSRVDIQILALTYQMCQERREDEKTRGELEEEVDEGIIPISQPDEPTLPENIDLNVEEKQRAQESVARESGTHNLKNNTLSRDQSNPADETLSQTMKILLVAKPNPSIESQTQGAYGQESREAPPVGPTKSDSENSDSEGWITPFNIKKHIAKDSNATKLLSSHAPIPVACLTTDFAMQNILLQLKLPLLSTSLQRVRHIKTYILRCHACFKQIRNQNTTLQFCPSCGKPTLTRVSCSTNSKGEFKIHLKKNMQWNHRGDRYSIPKAVSGSANGRGKGGGKGGWGQGLILAEDQKEYQRAIGTGKNGKKGNKGLDVMDADYLPGMLTGQRLRTGERPKVGAGRNVNLKRRG